MIFLINKIEVYKVKVLDIVHNFKNTTNAYHRNIVSNSSFPIYTEIN